MFGNRFILVIGVLSALLVTVAVSRPFANASVPNIAGANDFYERHPDWGSNAIASDYYQRHPELSVSAANALDLAGDFALRHPEWSFNMQAVGISMKGGVETSDYFQRHPELNTSAGIAVDMSDYFIRDSELRVPTKLIDLSDYFLRH
jgi:hypothetical protein